MDQRTLAERLASDLRRRITSGELEPGSKLPSEREIGEEFGMPRGTVRRALAILINEGLVSSRSGLGSFVRKREQLRYPAKAAESRQGRQKATKDVWQSWVESIGRHGNASVEVSISVPPLHVAEAFGVGTGEKVVTRRRVRTVDDEPWMISTAFFPLSIAEGTSLAQAGDLQPGPLVILREIGHEPIRHVDEIRSRMPTPEEIAILMLDAGVPLIEHTRISCDPRNEPCRATVNLFPADRFIVTYDIDES